MKGNDHNDTPSGKISEQSNISESGRTTGTETTALTWTPSSHSTLHTRDHDLPDSPATADTRNDSSPRFSASATLVILSGVSSASFAALVFLLLPFPAFVALVVFSTSLYYTLQFCFQLLAGHIQTVMQRRGIGDYLPPYIYNQLTNLTLHEWMQDTSFSLEYRHLLLYFVPGISPERLDHYVDALSPVHRNRLRQRGLGHLLGEDFMRLVMGNERYRVHALQNQPRPTELLLPPSLPTDLMNDAASDLDSTDHDFVSPMQASPPQSTDRDHTNRNAVVSRSLFVQEDDAEDDDEQEHLQREEQILTDAMMAMLNNYTNLSMEAITSGFAYTVDFLTPYIIGSGVFVASAAAGFAGFGRWSDNRMSRGAVSHLSWIPSNRALWTTAFIGGLSAGGIILIRAGVRRMVVRDSQSKDNIINKKKKKKKPYK
jgi:hypothetical protein